MKKLLLLLLPLFIYGISMGQNPVNDIMAISASNMNVVYAFLDNPITVVVPGVSPDKIVVTASAGTLTGEKGKYILRISDRKIPKNIILKISRQIKFGEPKEIASQVLRVKMGPKPVPCLGNYEGGEIPVKEVKTLDAVIVKLYDFYFEGISCTVKQYNFVYVPKDTITQKVVLLVGKTSLLTPEMKTILSNPKPGDKIFIYEIWCSFPGSKDMMLPGRLVLTIK